MAFSSSSKNFSSTLSSNTSIDNFKDTHRQEKLLPILSDYKDVIRDTDSKMKAQILDYQKPTAVEKMPMQTDFKKDDLSERDHNSASGSCLYFPPLDDSYQITQTQNVQFSISRKVEVLIHPQDPQLNYPASHEKHNGSLPHEGPEEQQSRRASNTSGNISRGCEGADDTRATCRDRVQRRASALRMLKTKSRLIDPSPESSECTSGMLRMPDEEEEDDPLLDDDLLEEYRKTKVNLLILVQWVSLVFIVTALIFTLAIPKWKVRKLWGLNLWKWEVLALVMISGRLISGWGIRIVVFFIERNFLLRKRVLYFVYGVRKAVQTCIWLGLVLTAWHYMFDNRVKANNKFLWYVDKLMLCMLLATLLWLVKTLMVKVLASSFHVSTFFDRIQDSLFIQYVIATLSGPPLTEIHCSQEEHGIMMAEVGNLQNNGPTLPPELRPGLSQKPSRQLSFQISDPKFKSQDDPGITIDHLNRLNTNNISAWSMKRLLNIIRHGSLYTLEEQIMEATKQDESATQIRSEYEAEVAARKIFRNVAKPGARFIYLEDLMCFLPEEEALKTMNFVEGSSNSEKISKASLKYWLVNAFRERKSLALTLNDTKTAVKNLHHITNVLVCIIIGIISLIILNIASSKFILFLSSQIVVVAFIFGNTCKTVFESIIFLFVLHPFDVGDRCEIDGVQMIVEEMNILTTVFLRYDNLKIMYPNSTLSTKPIHNYCRSPNMRDSVDFFVHIATPPEKIASMKQRILRYIKQGFPYLGINKCNRSSFFSQHSYIQSQKDYWSSNSSVVLMNLEDLQKLRMSVWITHRMNHQDMPKRWQRRALLLEDMVKIFKEMDVEYRLHPLDINIRSMPPPLDSDRVPPSWKTLQNQ